MIISKKHLIETPMNDFNLRTSSFECIIMHRVYKKKPDEEFSSYEVRDELVDADEEVHEILKDRLTEALGKDTRSFKLQVANSSYDSFFAFAKTATEASDAQAFIAASKDIAKKLAESQRTARPPEGYLLVIKGKTRTEARFLIAIKAEKESALSSKNDEAGRTVLEVIKNLFLSASMKFFKIGAIIEAKDTGEELVYPNNEYACFLFDQQFNPGAGPAKFFYEGFLGFDISRNAKIQSQRYYKLVHDWVSEHAETHAERKRMERGLKSIFWDDVRDEVDPRFFRDHYIQSDALKDLYTEQIMEEFPRSFTKDPTLLRNELKNRKLTFPNDIKVTGPEAHFDESVSVITDPEELDRLKDKLDSVTSLRIEGKNRFR